MNIFDMYNMFMPYNCIWQLKNAVYGSKFFECKKA